MVPTKLNGLEANYFEGGRQNMLPNCIVTGK